ncbi:hypothetical protein AB0E69_16470 [Kribbella sp. NPDC026611]|uniref:hypothetical protein n=1 Tax=Kribbella sp. NPDC026611 TaxID=3154911 RepID=UPI00340E38D7
MTDAAETARLVNTDLSTLTPTELKAHLAEVERQLANILQTERALLEANAEVLADHPELQARLAHLRTVRTTPDDSGRLRTTPDEEIVNTDDASGAAGGQADG